MIPDIIEKQAGWGVAAPLIGSIAGGVGGGLLSKDKLKGAVIGAGVGALGGSAARLGVHALGLTQASKDLKFIGAKNTFGRAVASDFSHGAKNKINAQLSGKILENAGKDLKGVAPNYVDRIADLHHQGYAPDTIQEVIRNAEKNRKKFGIIGQSRESLKQLPLILGGTYVAGQAVKPDKKSIF